ncbi:signal peptidase I [Candidatus Saccharibacteria bacterium]|nr:signal peptidase I [Candidatus Saccharibacteria bacterium]
MPANADNAKKLADTRLNKKLLSLGLRIILVVLMLLVLFGVVFGLKRMDTSVMQPSVVEGDLLLYYRLARDYNVGDVVVVNLDGRDMVLRIVAKAGQKVNITENGKVLVDDYPEALEPFYKTEQPDETGVKLPYVVPEGKIFVMGDYREATEDSREFGAVHMNDVKGKLMGRFQVRNF